MYIYIYSAARKLSEAAELGAKGVGTKLLQKTEEALLQITILAIIRITMMINSDMNSSIIISSIIKRGKWGQH